MRLWSIIIHLFQNRLAYLQCVYVCLQHWHQTPAVFHSKHFEVNVFSHFCKLVCLIFINIFISLKLSSLKLQMAIIWNYVIQPFLYVTEGEIDKLECSLLETFFRLFSYWQVTLEPTRVEHGTEKNLLRINALAYFVATSVKKKFLKRFLEQIYWLFF